MTDSIENVVTKIIEKTDILGKIINKCISLNNNEISEYKEEIKLNKKDNVRYKKIKYKYKIKISELENANILLNKINSDLIILRDNFISAITPYMVETNNEFNIEDSKLIKDFSDTILNNNFDGKVNLIAEKLLAYDMEIKNTSLYQSYKKIKIIIETEKIKYQKCAECGKKMDVIAESSELQCNLCGINFVMSGTICDDTQLFAQEDHKTKHGNYVRNKYVSKSLNQILGRKTIKISEAQFKNIDDYFRNLLGNKYDMYVSNKNITNEHMKEALKKLGYSKLYPGTTYILNKLYGIKPPVITEDEEREFYILSQLTFTEYNKIKNTNNGNAKNIKECLVRLSKQIIKDKKRRDEFRNAICLQKIGTLKKNNNVYKELSKICKIDYIYF